MEIPCEGLLADEYSLVINAFAGGAKAEQDLVITGVWECAVK